MSLLCCTAFSTLIPIWAFTFNWTLCRVILQPSSPMYLFHYLSISLSEKEVTLRLAQEGLWRDQCENHRPTHGWVFKCQCREITEIGFLLHIYSLKFLVGGSGCNHTGLFSFAGLVPVKLYLLQYLLSSSRSVLTSLCSSPPVDSCIKMPAL